MTREEEIAEEDAHVARLRELATEMAPHARALWRMGDGHGGGVFAMIAAAAGYNYFAESAAAEGDTGARRDQIPRWLSKKVFERDAYRCVTCGTHLDLTCDHVRPASLGGPTTFDNLQTMCRSCNSSKGARF